MANSNANPNTNGSNKSRPSRLGRGLSSLMSQPVAVSPTPAASQADEVPAADVPRETSSVAPAEQSAPAVEGIRYVSPSQVVPNRHQPRQHFDEAAIQSLADSIRADGLLQPIVVRPAGDPGRFELVAGERRWRACQQAGLETIPALVRELDDQQSAEIALIENVQREDLNAIERAQAFQALGDQFGLSHDAIAERVGLKRSSVTNLLRLLKLTPPCQQMVVDGLISMGQARAIAAIDEPDQQRYLAERAVRDALSVRQVEDAARKLNDGGAVKPQQNKHRSDGRAAYLADLEKQLGEQLGTKVTLKPGRKKGSGQMTISFFSLDQFDSICQALGVSTE